MALPMTERGASVSTSERDRGDRYFRRMATTIGVASLLVFTWFVVLGRADLLQTRDFGDVFDVQARSFLAGRLSVPDGSLGFEGFVIDGRTYAYFGIFPALIRLPILAVTDQFDGRLTALSMLMAYVTALWGGFAVVGRVRGLLRPDAVWNRTGLVLTGLLLTVLGVGSNLLFLASGAWVYHEASLWGVAGVLASFAVILDFLRVPRLRSVVIAGLWTLVAWTSRGSVGLAPSIVLGLLALGHLSGHRWLAVLAPRPPGWRAAGQAAAWPRDGRLGGALLVAAVAGGLVFGAVNAAKFGSPASLPMDKQVLSFSPPPDRAAALETYDGSLFSAELIPSVLYQSLRPDLVAPTGTWPFLRFTHARPPTPAGLVFDTVEPSAGLTVTSPLLLVLAGVGLLPVLRGRRRSVDGSVLRPFLLGGVAAAYAPLTIAFIAQRYLTDALPFLVVAAAVGVATVDRWAAPPPGVPKPPAGRVHALLGGFAVLAVVGVVTTMAVTWSFQRFVITPDAAAEAGALRAQVAVSEVIGSAPSVRWVDALPNEAPGRSLFAVGDCAALYRGQSDGGWVALERTPLVGFFRLRVDLRGPLAAGPNAVMAMGPPEDRLVIAVVASGDQARLVALRNGVRSTPGVAFDREGSVEMGVDLDPAFPWTKVSIDGRDALFVNAGGPPLAAPTIGTAGSDAGVVALGDRVTTLATPTPTCDALDRTR